MLEHHFFIHARATWWYFFIALFSFPLKTNTYEVIVNAPLLSRIHVNRSNENPVTWEREQVIWQYRKICSHLYSTCECLWKTFCILTMSFFQYNPFKSIDKFLYNAMLSCRGFAIAWMSRKKHTHTNRIYPMIALDLFVILFGRSFSLAVLFLYVCKPMLISRSNFFFIPREHFRSSQSIKLE